MSLGHSPKISMDGLILCLDAANTRSYSGSGLVWYDISPNGYNADLVDGPTYNGANKGSIYFNGTASYASLPSPSSRWNWTPSSSTGSNTLSIEMWVKTSDSLGYYISKPWNGNGEYNYYILPSGFYTRVADQNHTLSFTSLVTGNWEHVVAIVNPLQKAVYRNGVLDAAYTSHSITNNTPTSGNTAVPLSIMTYYAYASGWAGNTDYSIDGNVGAVRIYNRELSSLEVSQNYQALKGRYGR